MALDTKQYLDELLKEAGVPADDPRRQVIFETLGNEKAAKRLGDDVLRQSDYSRSMDKLKTDQQKTAEYYQSLVAWKAEQEAAALVERPQFHKVQEPTQPDLAAVQKKWEEQLAQRDGQMISLLKTGMSLASQHAVDFKERLDVDALEKIATEKKVSLQQAYDEYVAPRRSAIAEERQKAELIKAREEGAREFASTHKIPVDTAPREYHPIFDRDPKKQVGADDYVPNSGRLSPVAERTLRDNFVDAYNTASNRGTSGT